MKNFRTVFAAALALVALQVAAFGQTVSRQPLFVANQAWLDLGNGPTEILPLEGNGFAYTSSGSGVGSTSGSSTALTLTATAAANPPCVGCVISGTGITAGTTVASFNGTTTIGLSSAMTVAASTAVSWGMACPTSGLATSAQSAPAALRAGANNNTPQVPFYTYARVCIYSGQQHGLTLINFPVGAW